MPAAATSVAMSTTIHGLHPQLQSLIHTEFVRLQRHQAERMKKVQAQANSLTARKDGGEHEEADETLNRKPNAAAINSSSTIAGISTAATAAAPSSSAPQLSPFLTLSSLLRLSPPPTLPLDFHHLPTLYALDRRHRGAVSESDLLTFLSACDALCKANKWHLQPWTLRTKLKAHFVREMYLDLGRSEQKEQGQEEEVEDEKIEDDSSSESNYVPFVQWILSLLVNNHPTSSFKHVGLRVIYLHRESIELLWELLRHFFPRPPLTAALANHTHMGERNLRPTNINPEQKDEPFTAPQFTFDELCAISPSFNSITATSPLATHSFQSFFDLLQHTAEHAGLLDLDDEVLDHFVPIAIVEKMLSQIEFGFRSMMQRVGFEVAPSELAAKKAKKEAAAIQAAAVTSGPASTAASAHHSAHQSARHSRKTSISPRQQQTIYAHMKSSSLSNTTDNELFTMMSSPTPRSFVTPRNHATSSPAFPAASPSKHLSLPANSPTHATESNSTRVSNTHRLRNIMEEELRLSSTSPLFDGGDVDTMPQSPTNGVTGSPNSTDGSQVQSSQHPPLLKIISIPFPHIPTNEVEMDELRLPLHEIPPIDFTGATSGVTSGGSTSKMGSSDRTPGDSELMTPTSSHRHLMKRPPGVPSLSFVISQPELQQSRSLDQPSSGQIGEQRSGSFSVGGMHSHSSSLPSMPHTGVSIASTTVTGGNSSLSSLASSQQQTPTSIHLNPRRATGPLPQSKNVPSLPLHALHLPPGSPTKSPLPSHHYTYTHRMAHLLNQGVGGGQMNNLTVGHVQVSTPHRSPLMSPGGVYTPHRGPIQFPSLSGPHTPKFVSSSPLGSVPALDGPLPPSHASLLSSASKLTQHIHHVHDLAALTDRQVRQLVRDGANSDEDEDLDTDLCFDQSMEMEAPVNKTVVDTSIPIQEVVSSQAEDTIQLLKRKPRPSPLTKTLKDSGKTVLKATSPLNATAGVQTTTKPKVSPPSTAKRSELSTDSLKKPITLSRQNSKTTLSRQNSTSTLPTPKSAKSSTSPSVSRKSSGATGPPPGLNVTGGVNKGGNKSTMLGGVSSSKTKSPSVTLASSASASSLLSAAVKLPAPPSTLSSSPSAPKLAPPIKSFLTTNEETNLHPFGTPASADSVLIPPTPELKKTNSVGPTIDPQLISPIPRLKLGRE